MITPQEKTFHLKQKINQSLVPLIDSDYLLLDLPYHSNLGDTLIWLGEIDFLRIIPSKCKYSTWCGSNIGMMKKFLRPETIILFHGGGNFGDLWPRHNIFRKHVLSQYPSQKTIILPQTVYYSDKNNLKLDAEFYSHYPNVTICARDERSLKLLKEFFPNNPSILVPDMAFCMDMSHYKKCDVPQGSIFIKREDKEFNNDIYYEVPEEAYVSDWLFLEKSKEYLRQEKIRLWGAKFDHRLGTDWQHKLIDLYWYYVLRPLNAKTAISLLDKYAHVYTTRMHAAILSIILGKSDITLFDNSYGKSSSFYSTWLYDVQGLKMVRND